MNDSTKLKERVIEPWGWRHKVLRFPTLTEEIQVCSIGHAFGKAPDDLLPGEKPTYFVHDFLIDQSKSTGGGSALSAIIQFDLTKSRGYKYVVYPSLGKRFRVKLPPATKAFFSLCLGRCSPSTTGSYFDAEPATITFSGLAGPSPVITYNEFFIVHDNNSALYFQIEGDIGSDIEFEKLIISGRYGNRTFDPGAKWYEPLSYAVPFGTADIYPKSETFLMVGYQTQQTSDPGRFVTII